MERYDSITFDGEDVTWAAGIDLSLLKMVVTVQLAHFEMPVTE